MCRSNRRFSGSPNEGRYNGRDSRFCDRDRGYHSPLRIRRRRSLDRDDVYDSDYRRGTRRDRFYLEEAELNLKCIEILKSRNLSFDGDSREGPEEFLAQVEDCEQSLGMRDRDARIGGIERVGMK